jgi:hypothetical protein
MWSGGEVRGERAGIQLERAGILLADPLISDP